jgi:putative transposase
LARGHLADGPPWVRIMTDDLFALFDPTEDVEISRRNLPHWQQAGKTYFITFRTADSLPETVFAEWLESRNAWLRAHRIDPSNRNWRSSLAGLPITVQREFHTLFSERFEKLLDDCHGKCVLRQPSLAKVVADSLLHFDGKRYEVSDFVVMPNHVHLLVQFTAVEMNVQCESWKHFTAVQINRSLGQSGVFWQTEQFDTLVRNDKHFNAIRQYIAGNPSRANLRQGEFIHYARKDLR